MPTWNKLKPSKAQGEKVADFDENENLEKISKNLSKLSKSEKMDLLKQESPELFELSKDFDEKVCD